MLSPPVITTGSDGSFARRTITQRKPWILAQLAGHPAAGPIARDLSRFQEELAGAVAPVDWPGYVPRPIARRWLPVMASLVGRPWLNIPWFTAEALFYLKVLLLWGYYNPACPRFWTDPFTLLKQAKLPAGPELESLAAQALGPPGNQQLSWLIGSQVWSNPIESTCRIRLDHSRSCD